MRYVVTNVRLEASMLRSVKLRAVQRGVPAAAIIREAIQQYLESPEMTREEREKALRDFLKGCGVPGKPGAPQTGSTDIDEVLYGIRPRRRKR